MKYIPPLIPYKSLKSETVSIRDILRDEALQVRRKLHETVVRKYAEAMESGAEFPAIELANVKGTLFLVDGWHRLAASDILGFTSISAHVTIMSLDEAKWAAAKANTEHGLALQSSEYREVFRAFMDSGMYRKGRSWLSYRDISKHIGKGFSTIRNWMQADYPRLFAVYQSKSNSNEDVDLSEREALVQRKRLKQAEGAIENSRNIGRTLEPELLGELIATLRASLSELEMNPYTPYISPMEDAYDDF